MTRGRAYFLLTSVFLIVGFFIWGTNIFAAENDLQITEIMYDTPGADAQKEWLEIKNTGSGVVEIIGGSASSTWRLFDGSNHTFSTSTVINPGEYCVVAQDAASFLSNYPLYSGKLLESSFSLTNSSGTAALRLGSEGTLWSEVNYENSWGAAGNGKTLEKIDETGLNTTANWQESFVLGGSPGALHSEAPIIATTTTSTPGTPQETTTSTPEVIEIKINEVYPVVTTSSEKEWVELFNPTSSTINLAGWFLLDNSSTTTLEGEVPPQGFWIVEFSNRLNNSGDRLILKDVDGEIMDQIAYGNFDDGNLADNLVAPASGQSLARIIDGFSTGNNQDDFSLTTIPTKQAPNVINKPVIFSPVVQSSGSIANEKKSFKIESENEEKNFPIILSVAEKKVVLNELLPNPKGSDTQKEMIELKNIFSQPINLEGWFLLGSNKRKYVFTSSTILLPGAFLVLSREQTKITLKNSNGDFVELYNANKQLADRAVYQETAAENFVYIRTTSTADIWAWSTMPTLGQENILLAPNYPPEVFLNIPSSLMAGEEGVFEAGDTFDPDDDTLHFLWDLDGNLLEGETVSFSFASPGKKKISLTVDDYHGHIIIKKTSLQIEGETDAIEKTSSAPRVNKTKNKILQNVSLAEIKNLAVGDLVKTMGVIVVPPGIFSTQMFFIADAESGAGIPIYMYSKDFPEIKEGDKVEISGELGSYLGSLRLKVKNKTDIDILSIDNVVKPLVLNSSDIDDDKIFSLVALEGEVLETASGYFYLGDDQGEIKVQIKSKTGLKGKIVGLGDKVKVVGIVGKSKDAWVLWPRGAEDIQISSIAPPVNKETTNDVTEKYLTATAGGVTSLLLALLAKGRGALAKAVAFGFISKITFWKKRDNG